jgi:DNA-binding NtrC family response regulator
MHSTVLLASQYPMRCGSLLDLLREGQPSPVLASDTRQVIEAVTKERPVGLVVVHGTLPYCDPILKRFAGMRASRLSPPLIVVATESSEDFAITALRAGALDYFGEPLDLIALGATISRLSLVVSDTVLAGGEVLVGNSATMKALRQHILRVAATDCNVLITGETGTGKELVAQLLHQNSARRMHRLVCINCAAVPDSLLESELFGYERGSFTGAHATSQGKVMSADKGTIFFDEIGDMSAYGQAKILRLIESKEVQRLGSTRKLTTDVRVLAATHHNLTELSSKQTFRQDLYFRLNVGRIHLPPLRERKNDIADLVARIVVDLNGKLGRCIQGVTEDGMRGLMEYDWPGNVRELKNVMERIFIDRDAGKITERDILDILPRDDAAQPLSERNDEMQVLMTMLVSCQWNKSKAAEKLNWSRMTLYRKLAKYGLANEAMKKGAKSIPAKVLPNSDGAMA